MAEDTGLVTVKFTLLKATTGGSLLSTNMCTHMQAQPVISHVTTPHDTPTWKHIDGDGSGVSLADGVRNGELELVESHLQVPHVELDIVDALCMGRQGNRNHIHSIWKYTTIHVYRKTWRTFQFGELANLQKIVKFKIHQYLNIE